MKKAAVGIDLSALYLRLFLFGVFLGFKALLEEFRFLGYFSTVYLGEETKEHRREDFWDFFTEQVEFLLLF